MVENHRWFCGSRIRDHRLLLCALDLPRLWKDFGPLDFVLYAANVILCPPILLFSLCIDCEYGTPAGVEANLITVGLLNTALYAMIGIAVAVARRSG